MAVIDTGIGLHPDITSERIVVFRDFVAGRQQAYDDSGHGTHVCGILGGSGRLRSQLTGIAPACHMVVLKALDEKGDGNPERVMEALNWVAEYRVHYDIRLVNLSFGADCDTKDEQYFEMAKLIRTLWRNGVCVVCSAGNQGPERGSITFPGCCPETITVGAMEKRFVSGLYSGRGPTPFGGMKPDLVAPAGSILSLSPLVEGKGGIWQSLRQTKGIASTMPWTEKAWEKKLRSGVMVKALLPIGYTRKSGTSMSAPVVSGAICLLLQKEPGLHPDEVRERLWNSSVNLGYSAEQQGHGMLNIQRLLGI